MPEQHSLIPKQNGDCCGATNCCSKEKVIQENTVFAEMWSLGIGGVIQIVSMLANVAWQDCQLMSLLLTGVVHLRKY